MDTEAQLKALNRGIGWRLKMARKWRNLLIEDFAARCGTTASETKSYEAGASRICAEEPLQIVLLLDLPIAYLFRCLKSRDRKRSVHE